MSGLHGIFSRRLHILLANCGYLFVCYLGNATQVQRPSLWVFDLEKNVVIRRFEIPESIVQSGNGLASVTIDVQRNACDDAFAYIPDLAAYRLHVYRCL